MRPAACTTHAVLLAAFSCQQPSDKRAHEEHHVSQVPDAGLDLALRKKLFAVFRPASIVLLAASAAWLAA